MYNRYLSAAHEEHTAPCQEILHTPVPACDAPCAEGSKPQGGGLLSGLSEALTGRLKTLHFDMDTLIILIAVYFLLADSEDFDTDLLILIGVLFILGF